MTQTNRPPFRADHVGSLLRPEKLKEARETLLGPQTADAHLGPHNNEMLTRIEDDCIRDVVTMQEKEELLIKMREEGWFLFFEHDPNIQACTVDRLDKHYRMNETVIISE